MKTIMIFVKMHMWIGYSIDLRANAHKNQTKSENSDKSVKTQNRSNFGYQ